MAHRPAAIASSRIFLHIFTVRYTGHVGFQQARQFTASRGTARRRAL